ncbi:type VII secretion protein EccB [Streptomyces sp. NPDC056485]|uniref:type VII secretion protein EccB n=1 Tax=Streptomyces sp. NPDC056485 TaxID=3345834 RepID=UPI0036AB056C
MQNKRDQVHAHMFLMGRLTSGMLRADPDSPESPQGRTNRGIAIGVIVAVLVSAGAFVFGLLAPGTKDSWRSSGALIVEKETGSRYLYVNGRLRPVRNYASARLLLGTKLKTTTVGSASLKDTPHGASAGIQGAPDGLPSARNLSKAPWQVCSSTGPEGQGPVSTLAVAAEPTGTPLGERQGLLATGPDGTPYVLWSGMRLRLDAQRGAREALGYGSAAPLKVSAALLGALPAGPDLTPPEVPGRGSAGPQLGGRATRIGQLFQVSVMGADAPRTYLLRQEGLRPVSATTAALMLGDPQTREKAYAGESPAVAELGADALRGRLAPDDPAGKDAERLPQSPPQLMDVPKGSSPCVRITPAGADAKGTRISMALVDSPALGPVAESSDAVAAPCTPIDRVTVPPGGGVLVQALSASGAQVGGTLYLVTGTGLKYRIVSTKAAEALGYDTASAQGLPSQFLGMLPSGPDLSTEAAQEGRSQVTGPVCK